MRIEQKPGEWMEITSALAVGIFLLGASTGALFVTLQRAEYRAHMRRLPAARSPQFSGHADLGKPHMVSTEDDQWKGATGARRFSRN
jgi:hypothetical protein